MNTKPNFTNNSWNGFNWLLAVQSGLLLLLLWLLFLARVRFSIWAGLFQPSALDARFSTLNSQPSTES